MNKKIVHSILILIGVIILNLLLSKYYTRFDFTSDKRYTLSETTINLAEKVDENLMIRVYLSGEFPLDFKRLEQETKQHLDELNNYNSKIHYRFINPSGKEEELIKKGLKPSRLTVEENSIISERIIFPWAVMTYGNKSINIPLLVDTHVGQENQLQRSIESLEYAFSHALSKIAQGKRKSIAILRGNGELEDIYLFDFLKSLQEQYDLAPFTIRDSQIDPKAVLKDLQNFDLAIIAKPTQIFSEKDKLILDQFITSGGKTLWLIDAVTAEMDSLQQTGEAFFTARDLNLTDLLFSYGVRINHNLVQDLYSSKIALATGNVGNQTQFQQFLWPYYPLVISNLENPITKNLEAVNFKFPSSIDTLKNGIKKSILLQSSRLSKISSLPNLVSLSSIADKANPASYNAKPQILGVLLEGKFESAYKHRTKPFDNNYTETSPANKMIILSDGDLIANQVLNGEPTRLDLDKWTGQHFGNKDFLHNSVDYLLDDNGLFNIRGKSLSIKLLNKEKVHKEKRFWQFVTIVVPLLLLGIFGFLFSYFRKRKYS